MNVTQSWLLTLVAVVVLVFVGLLEATILWYIWSGRINISRLISEPTGDASLSRLQLLIFTFVIAASLFFVIVVAQPPAFPKEIPAGVLTLLGISGSTYLVSKGIQFSNDEGIVDRPSRVTVEPKSIDAAGKAALTQKFTANVERGDDKKVVWYVDSLPQAGTISPDGTYTGPAAPLPAGTKVVIKAESVADCRAKGYAEINF